MLLTKSYHQLKWRKCNNLFKPKKTLKSIQFKQLFAYCTHNKNEIKGSLKIRAEAKRTSHEIDIWKTISWQDIAGTIFGGGSI